MQASKAVAKGRAGVSCHTQAAEHCMRTVSSVAKGRGLASRGFVARTDKAQQTQHCQHTKAQIPAAMLQAMQPAGQNNVQALVLRSASVNAEGRLPCGSARSAGKAEGGQQDMKLTSWTDWLPRHGECCFGQVAPNSYRSAVCDMQLIRQCSAPHLTCGRCLQKPCCQHVGFPGGSS